jgi:hypothetical protein
MSATIVPGNAGHHGVQFYSCDDRLCESVADFLGDGIAAQQPVVIFATPDHGHRISSELAARRFDVESLIRARRLTLLDAEASLERFMVDGYPDPARFQKVVGEIIDAACSPGSDVAVRAYGEMVDVLWRRGHRDAAIQLEILWNGLARTHAFSLLCGYAMGHFYKEIGCDEVCALHTHVYGPRPDQTAG